MTTTDRSTSPATRVLIVDDEEDIALLLADGLESRGFVTYVAHDGCGALQVVDEYEMDVVLLDLALPDIDGFEVARRLIASGREDLVLVAVTAFSDSRHRSDAVAAGFAGYVVKPVILNELAQRISDLLDERAARRVQDNARDASQTPSRRSPRTQV
jgi:two-component system OmpR family response regulator